MNSDLPSTILLGVIIRFVSIMILLAIGCVAGGLVTKKSQTTISIKHVAGGVVLIVFLAFLLRTPNGGGGYGAGAALGSGVMYTSALALLWLYLGAVKGKYIKTLKNRQLPNSVIIKNRIVLLGILPLILIIFYSATTYIISTLF